MENKSKQTVSQEIPDAAQKSDNDSISDVLQAAGISNHQNDPTEPVLTLRMWVLGILFCAIVSGLNTLYTLRNPSITISSSVVLLLSYPLGKLWEKVVPNWNARLRSWSFSLNPGPFNQKEHVLIYIMSNLSIYVRLGADVLTEQQMFYGYKTSWGFQVLITLSTFLIGFCLAGLFRSVVIEPRELIWPGLLGTTALTSTLHNVEKGSVQEIYAKYRMSRYAFFTLVFCISFCWYWFPDFIFPALSYFTFPCWINPKSKVVNQLFGMTSGMGLLPITFDWSQISYVGSPLLVPSWAILNVFLGLVFWIWIVAVACYYTNTWYTGYLPFQSSSVYDNTGAVYKASRIVNKADGYKIDVAKYESYSPVYMPVTYAINMFGLSFATISSLLVWVILEQRHVMMTAVRRLPKLISGSLLRRKNISTGGGTGQIEVPIWWYLICCLIALFMSIFAVEYWNAELRWYGVLLACAVALIFYAPLALVYATANLKINIDIFCRIVAGFVFEGKVLANIWFFDLGYITTIKGLYFAQDMKLAHYCNVPQKSLFLVQCVGMIVGTLSSLGVLNWSLNHIEGVCTTDGTNGFTCPYSRTHFNTSLIWGAIGPWRYFTSKVGYHSLFYFFIIGAILPIPVYFMKQRRPSSFWRHINVPLFLGGLNYLPPATGTSYGSWAVVGLIFGWFIRRRLHAWWYKYNFVTSSALDSSVSMAGVVIFFSIYYSGASSKFSWWGTTVYKNTCDYKGCAHLEIPESGKFGP
ncbi:OPT oligopeptide transporter protein-domain-containing protein [Talaromyces proteolyticus]|uniref:OPT oligopeptide transporter protein-domain-containing protein n=1 Tax=Talaromyces proteolyticus TaxID=1131652 RepID=A0AAD4Q2B9_9EURO|nr:OPT oligopeptide transporter protein-domain-containing protein [Talaromyces proteolyticus]KAH8703517.1 OPT oligopeptide transporter protein-domain-containing protein [Talaromyces proteolyticus]